MSYVDALFDPMRPHDPIFHDPIFKFGGLIREAYRLDRYAEQKNVVLYLIDAMPFDMWENDGFPVAVTNSIVLHEFSTEKLFRLPDTWCGIYYHPYSLHSTVPVTKAFNCFINRMDPFRQSWLYLLVRRGLFDQGYISFNMEVVRHSDEYKHLDPITVFETQFERYCNNFQSEHEFILNNKLVPYCNFTDNGDVTPVCYASNISLVLETTFDNNNVITYSEKIFRALQIPRPWLLFCHCRAVKHLRNMGFDVLDDIVDHESYDSLECAVARQSQILDLMPALIAKSMDNNRLVQAAQHNQNLLAKFSKTWLQDIKSVIDQASTHA
jgi:hypothetical protein